MVSELAGEGAMPLPAPVSHAELRRIRLRRSIRRGTLVRQKHSNPSIFQVFSHNRSIDRSSDVQSFYSSIYVSARSIETLDRSWKLRIDLAEPRVLLCGDVVINLNLKKDINQNMEFKSVYANFICDGDDSSRSAIFKDRSSSKVLIGPLFVVFDRTSWSRSMKSWSRVLVDSLFTAFNHNSRRRFVESMSRMLINRSSRSRFAERSSAELVNLPLDSRSRSVKGTSRVLVYPSSIAVPGADPMEWKQFRGAVAEIDPLPPPPQPHFSHILRSLFIERSILGTSEALSARVKSKGSVIGSILPLECDVQIGSSDRRTVLLRFATEDEYKIHVFQNARACLRLCSACERLRKVLSANEFEQISIPIFERVKKPLEKAIAEAGLTVENIQFQISVIQFQISPPKTDIEQSFGYAYPTCECFKAVETESVRQTTSVVFGFVVAVGNSEDPTGKSVDLIEGYAPLWGDLGGCHNAASSRSLSRLKPQMSNLSSVASSLGLLSQITEVENKSYVGTVTDDEKPGIGNAGNWFYSSEFPFSSWKHCSSCATYPRSIAKKGKKNADQ